MTKKILSITVAVMAILIGLYPSVYFFIHHKFGLLNSKSDTVLNNIFWNIEFYIHITSGGLALLIGWTQFSIKFRTANLAIHRRIGKIYVIAVLFSATAGFYIALYATGGVIPSLGFICLAAIWFSTTLKAYLEIKKGRTDSHQQMMIYSYAACFAAVTLRILLPLLVAFIGDFNKAYSIVAWLCWIPNMVVAYFLAKRFKNQKENTMQDFAIAG